MQGQGYLRGRERRKERRRESEREGERESGRERAREREWERERSSAIHLHKRWYQHPRSIMHARVKYCMLNHNNSYLLTETQTTE